jgi:cystathionine beta-lyase
VATGSAAEAAARFDAITIEQLRAAGSRRWTAYPDCIGAFEAEIDFGVAPPIASALHGAIDRGFIGYLPATLERDVAEACADWYLESHGWRPRPEWIHRIGDVLSGLEVTVRHYSMPGRPVVVPTPAYMPFIPIVRALGREAVEVPMLLDRGRWILDLEEIGAALGAGAEVVVLCNPHNPLGRVHEPDELVALAEVVARHGGRVFADEVHAPITYDGARHVPYASVSDAAAGHTITATSASKAWDLAGLKCAQLILSNERDEATWAGVDQLERHGTGTLGALANLVAYRQGRRWLDDVREYLTGNRARLGELLGALVPEVGYVAPQGTYLAWLDLRELGLAGDVGAFFRERAGVALTDGAECGEAGRGFVRFNFAMPRPILERAIEQMAAAIRAAGRASSAP